MCNLKITGVEELVRGLKRWDAEGKSMSVRELAELYVSLDDVSKELKKAEEQIELALKDANVNELFPAIEKKVIVAEGRKSTDYDNNSVFARLVNEGIPHMFPVISKIEKGRVEKIAEPLLRVAVEEAINAHSQIKEGAPSVGIRKMTKQELVEAKQ